MEFCKRSKPTIKMRNRSKKEHINCNLFEIKTPGIIQFSVKENTKTQVLGTPAETKQSMTQIDVPIQENQLNCTRKVAEMCCSTSARQCVLDSNPMKISTKIGRLRIQ